MKFERDNSENEYKRNHKDSDKSDLGILPPLPARDIPITKPSSFISNRDSTNERNTDSSHGGVAKKYRLNTGLKEWSNRWTNSTSYTTNNRVQGIDKENRNQSSKDWNNFKNQLCFRSEA